MSSNDAADILRGHLAHLTRETVYEVAWLQALDNALEEERRATVERIRLRLNRNRLEQRTGDILAILDDEAAR